MTGEDKMNRIFVYIGIIAGLLLGGSLSVEGRKKTAFIRFPYAEGNIAEWRYRASGVL